MQVEKSIDEALSLIPGWRGANYSWTVLARGLTNRSFLVERDAIQYVLRLDAPHTALFSLDRETELQVHRRAALAQLAPQIIYANPDEGVQLHEYVQGSVLTIEDLRSKAVLESVASALQKVHSLERCGKAFSSKAAAEVYIDAVGLRGPWLETARRCQAIIERSPVAEDSVCSHNDPVADNFIDAGRLIMIDWEYACDNDAFFDLAVVVSHHGLGRREADMLLSAYWGELTAERRQRLQSQVQVYDALHWLWLAARNVATSDPRMLAVMRRLAGRIKRYG
jgi:thiamine kinase-like enzyme